ncbi:hypothetical protein JCM13991_21890 [Thermodesulfovibrio hydrogeniphilus]
MPKFARYDSFEEFEEIELLINETVVLCIAILNGQIKRIMFPKNRDRNPIIGITI